jgi:hypothetical protein
MVKNAFWLQIRVERKKYVVSNIELVDNLGLVDKLMTKQVRATIFLKNWSKQKLPSTVLFVTGSQ